MLTHSTILYCIIPGVFRYFLSRDAPSPSPYETSPSPFAASPSAFTASLGPFAASPGPFAASPGPYASAIEDDSTNPPTEQLLLVQTTKVNPCVLKKPLPSMIYINPYPYDKY